MWANLGLADLRREAAQADELMLPRLVPGWQGAALAVAGAAVGEWWAVLSKGGASPSATSSTLGWLALALIFVGLLMQLTRLNRKGGWRVHFSSRRVEPVGVPGHPVDIDGTEGWSVACMAGDRFRSVAIDLRHAERGRVARLFESPARTRMRDIRACSALTDELARRLGVAREGLVA